MKKVILGLLLVATTGHAESRFEGEYIGSVAFKDPEFIKSLPAGTKMNCGKYQCDGKWIRVFIFKNADGQRWFWSSNQRDTVIDSIAKWGTDGHIVYYDDLNQMMHYSNVGIEDDIETSKRLEHSVAPTYKQLVEMGNELEERHKEELKKRLEEETKKYWGKQGPP